MVYVCHHKGWEGIGREFASERMENLPKARGRIAWKSRKGSESCEKLVQNKKSVVVDLN